jgi:multidrug efflux system membrane fusion protein
LQTGDRIVIDGADKLRDGARINVRPPTDASKPADAGATQDQNGGQEKQDKAGSGKKRRSEGGQKQ